MLLYKTTKGEDFPVSSCLVCILQVKPRMTKAQFIIEHKQWGLCRPDFPLVSHMEEITFPKAGIKGAMLPALARESALPFTKQEINLGKVDSLSGYFHWFLLLCTRSALSLAGFLGKWVYVKGQMILTTCIPAATIHICKTQVHSRAWHWGNWDTENCHMRYDDNSSD